MNIDLEKHAVVISQVEPAPYFPDDKILSPAQDDSSTIHSHPTLEPIGLTVVERAPPDLPEYAEEKIPVREERRPFWKRRLIWLLVILMIITIAAVTVASILLHQRSTEKTTTKTSTSRNSTTSSVASSGLFLRDGTTWNMQVYMQNSTGGIQFQMSLDGKIFGSQRNISLEITPMTGSSLSAAASTDSTGVVYLTLFYMATSAQIAVCQMACGALSSTCSTTSNSILTTTVPPSANTGLAAVNVDDAQDWRVYYLDNSGLVSQLQGNSSGFDGGQAIGGAGLNGSSMAAVNVNSTTNNINVFYVDMLTKDLFTLEFTKGAWTVPVTITPQPVASWNPLSGLGAAYSTRQDQLHVYYTGNDSGIYEFLGSNASTTNTNLAGQPDRNHVWATADFPGLDITAVGWEDEVRSFQVEHGRLVQGSLSNTTWSESFV